MEGSLTSQQANDGRNVVNSDADSLPMIELPSSSSKRLQNSHRMVPTNMVIVDPSNPKTQSPLRDNSSPSLPCQPDIPPSVSSSSSLISSQPTLCPLARNNNEERQETATTNSADAQSYESDSDDSELAASIEIAEEGEDGVINVSSDTPRLLIIDELAKNSINKTTPLHSSATAGTSLESETLVVASEVEKNKSDMSTAIQVSLNGANTSEGDVKATTTAFSSTAKPTGGLAQKSVVTSSINGVAGHRVLSQPARCKQSAKVKQCFTTLQTFGNNMSQDVAEQVHELISALVSGVVTVEEFHQEIQKITNHPLKEIVIPFLKENLDAFREELKQNSMTLADILGSTPQSNTPATASEYGEPELVVVPSTKPSPTPSTSCTTPITTAPTSPFKAPSNLTSMSAGPATIFEEPYVLSPTPIETIPNSSAVTSTKKRPRDLFVDSSSIVSQPELTPSLSSSQSHGTAAKRPRTNSISVGTGSSSNPHSPSSAHLRSTPPIYHSPGKSVGHQHFQQPQTTPTIEGAATVLIPSSNHRVLNLIREDLNHLETMMVSVEGMVAKTQRSLAVMRERIQQSAIAPSPIQQRQMEMEQEATIQSRIQRAVEESKQAAAEEKQRLLMEASRQMRDALREANVQSDAKENCWNCGRNATETCSGCNNARYCGRFCQHKDWDKHMKHCEGVKTVSRIDREMGNTATVTVDHTPAQMAAPTPMGACDPPSHVAIATPIHPGQIPMQGGHMRIHTEHRGENVVVLNIDSSGVGGNLQ